MNPSIGFDLGSNLGWATCDRSGALASGLRILRSTGPGNEEGQRFAQFVQFFHGQLLQVGANGLTVYYEEVEFLVQGLAQPRLYFGMRSLLLSECHRRGIPVIGLRVQAIKQHATGRGNADKFAMMRAACAKWPEQNVTDNNQADALWILDAGRCGLTSAPPRKTQVRCSARAAKKLQPELFKL